MIDPAVRELDYRVTPLGELVLRCRRSPHVQHGLVYEVKLDDEMLMSSSVNESERALARLALDGSGGEPCDVLIGGLGLGYTAAAALEFPHVRRVDVIELLAPVIEWHRASLVPAALQLLTDPRCSLMEGDFFERVTARASVVPRRYDAILVDIDHSPDCLLHPRHGGFYSESGLAGLARHLRAGGVFGLWSAEQPSSEFVGLLARVFASVRLHEAPFFNPHVGEADSNWILLGNRPPDADVPASKGTNQMDRKTKKRVQVVSERLRKRRHQLLGAMRQPDDPREADRLKQEIAGLEVELRQLQGEHRQSQGLQVQRR